MELLIRLIPIALAAPAIACGLSRPLTLESFLPRGVGSILDLLFPARELAGLIGFGVGARPPQSETDGRRLTLRFAASELAGLMGFDGGVRELEDGTRLMLRLPARELDDRILDVNSVGSLLKLGWRDARRSIADNWDVERFLESCRGRIEGDDWERTSCEYGPGVLGMRAREPKREFEGREGVTSGAGEVVLSRLRGDLVVILDAIERLA